MHTKAMWEEEDYHILLWAKPQGKIAKMETIVNNKCQNIYKDQREVEFHGWIIEHGYSRTQDTKILSWECFIGSTKPL